MQVKAHQLEGQLKKGLAPVYLICGDDPLQSAEACDSIRQAARQQGYTERELLHVDKSFDWNTLGDSANVMSLFAEQRLIELRLPSGKPGDKGGKALIEYCSRLPEDTVLLVISGKIDKRSHSTKWYKALDGVAVVCHLWPIETRELPGWIVKRASKKGLKLSPGAASLLADQVEGNLLAASQEVEKLALLYNDGVLLDEEAILQSVGSSARYDLFGMVDAALLGDAARLVKMFQGLRGEGNDPILVLWALGREVRSMAAMAGLLQQGASQSQVFSQYRVWDKRKPAVSAALKRHKLNSWRRMVLELSTIDRMVKGGSGNAWDELLQLALWVSGVRLFEESDRLMKHGY